MKSIKFQIHNDRLSLGLYQIDLGIQPDSPINALKIQLRFQLQRQVHRALVLHLMQGKYAAFHYL